MSDGKGYDDEFDSEKESDDAFDKAFDDTMKGGLTIADRVIHALGRTGLSFDIVPIGKIAQRFSPREPSDDFNAFDPPDDELFDWVWDQIMTPYLRAGLIADTPYNREVIAWRKADPNNRDFIAAKRAAEAVAKDTSRKLPCRCQHPPHLIADDDPNLST
jgi:hypothetical protein